MNKKKSFIAALLLVVVAGLSITAGTFAYFQWTTGAEGGTSVNVTIEMGGIKMHIEPEATGFVGLYPTAHCENNVRYGDTLVRIENNTGALAIPSFKLKVKINPSVADTGKLSYYKEHIHYAVVALETTKDAQGNPVKGDPVGGNILDNLVTGTCKNPLSVSSTQDTDDTFKSDYGKNATGLFNTITAENTFADTGFLPREYNSTTGKVSGVTFRGEAYSTSYQYYRVYVWIDEGYTTTIIGNDVTDPLQNAGISVTWSENSMLQQVSGVSNVEPEPVRAAGLYDNDGNLTSTWQQLLDNNDIAVVDNVITTSDEYLTGSLVIPEGITEIGESAFQGSQLTNIKIPGGVVSIGVYAFANTQLTGSLVIPASVISIGEYAFGSGNRITSVIFESNSQLTSIGDTAFAYTALISIEIPASVTSIGSSAFFDSMVEEITFAENSQLKTIGNGVFAYAAELTYLELPASITSIDIAALEGCSSLTTIKFKGTMVQWNAISKGENWNLEIPATEVICSDGAVNLMDAGLYQTDGTFTSWDTLVNNGDITVEDNVITDSNKELTGYLVVPEGITEIGGVAFGDISAPISNISGIYIPSTVTKIGFGAFYNSTLNELKFAPNSQLVTIDDNAFLVSHLISIDIPAGVTKIGLEALATTTLSTIRFEGTVEEWNGIEKHVTWNYNVPATYVQCSDGRVELG